ncbi:MAG: STAS domain-containing protein [Ignavibacteriae bacterium]|nr:STAS domain-containing protein [Ignavibacteriota bacterium]
MNNNIRYSDIFKATKLEVGIVILKLKSSYISLKETKLFIEAISLFVIEGHKNFIIDLSETNYLDSLTLTMLVEKIKEIGSIGGSVNLVVTETKPRLKYTVGNPLAKLQVCLNVENALNNF